MFVHDPLPMLAGLSPAGFMQRHWQRRPLLVRRAFEPGAAPLPLIDRRTLFALAARADVESRLIVRLGEDWQVVHGPQRRRALPPLRQPGWTLLVQGLDLHHPPAHRLLRHFRFLPAARLDDVMVSWASHGGGVGPHFDSYDVFLLQIHGQRRWRIGRSRRQALVPGLPLKILRHFEPEEDWLLAPGDMLYLPPRWAHDGVAEGECMTCSVGFRAPRQGELASELLARIADGDRERLPDVYADPEQRATRHPGRVPASLQRFAKDALRRWLADPQQVAQALGEWLTEPKPQVWFDPGRSTLPRGRAVNLAAATRMLYDGDLVFVNGESFHASGLDASLMRRLADERRLDATSLDRLSRPARALVGEWLAQGWLARE